MLLITQRVCSDFRQTKVRELLAKVLDVSLSAEVISNYLLEKPM